MSGTARGAVVVCGIGNDDRGDDGAGLAVARRVAAMHPAADGVEPLGEPVELIGRWDHAALAVVVDATRTGAAPGTVTERVLDGRIPTRKAVAERSSTHALGVVDVYRLARAVGTAPCRAVLVGLEGGSFTVGTGLSPAVARSVEAAARRVMAILEAARPAPGRSPRDLGP